MIAAAVVGPPVTREGARTAAQRELSKGIYHRYDDPWPVRAFRAVQHAIGHLLDAVARHSPGGGVGALALIALAVLLLAIAVRRVGFVRRETRRAGAILPDRVRTAADFRRLAEDAAAAGRWEDAVLARMRGLTRDLEERGVLDPRPGRTADELAAEVAVVRPVAAVEIAAAARIFDEVAYGSRPADRQGYDVVTSADRAVTAGPDRRRLPAGRPA